MTAMSKQEYEAMPVEFKLNGKDVPQDRIVREKDEVRILDKSGNTVSTFNGTTRMHWDCRDVNGIGLPSGTYIVRVVATDGSLGGYAGGLDAKRRLLALERGEARVPAGGWPPARKV